MNARRARPRFVQQTLCFCVEKTRAPLSDGLLAHAYLPGHYTVWLTFSDVQKFVPVLFADAQVSWVPFSLRGLPHYRVHTEEGYEDLYRHLTNQPGTPMPPVGQ